MDTPKTKFEKVIQGRNVCTPRVLAWFSIANGAVEFSTVKIGEPNGYVPLGIIEKNFGVTVVENGKLNREKSKPFFTQKEGEDYIKSLNPISVTRYEEVGYSLDPMPITRKYEY